MARLVVKDTHHKMCVCVCVCVDQIGSRAQIIIRISMGRFYVIEVLCVVVVKLNMSKVTTSQIISFVICVLCPFF
jgi:hypothetical protein